MQGVKSVATRYLKSALNDLVDDDDDERAVERPPPKVPTGKGPIHELGLTESTWAKMPRLLWCDSRYRYLIWNSYVPAWAAWAHTLDMYLST